MDKVYVVYWSGTGNTKQMAEEVVKGAIDAGVQAEAIEADQIDIAELVDRKAFALGCPSMGNEQLEEDIMEPFVCGIEDKVQGKTIVLFGSYGWGDGEWMRNWTDRMVEHGATVYEGEGIIANNEPDEEVLAHLREAGKALAAL